jgi:hypothetical protein
MAIGINDMQCNAKITQLKANGWTHTTNGVVYNAKSSSNFDKKKIQCAKGEQYFYKSKTTTPPPSPPPPPGPPPSPPPGPPPSPRVRCNAPSTGFSSVSQGNKFRDFVYKYYPSVAGEHDLWLSNDPRLTRLSKSYDTCSMKKSYAEIDQRDPMNRAIGNLFLLWSQDPNALTWLGGSNSQQNMNDPKVQEGVWEKLIENNQIYSKGLIVKAGNKTVYVIKTDLNNDVIKYKLTSIQELKSPNVDKFDYIVLYPIDITKKYPVGEVGLLYKTINQDGDEVIKIKKEPTWTWEPADAGEGLELQEQVINKGAASSDQGVKTPGSGINRGTGTNTGSGTNTGTGTNTGSGTNTGTGTNAGTGSNTGTGTNTGTGASTKDDLRKLFGFVTNEGVTYNPKQKILNMERNQGSVGQFNQGSIQNAIDKFEAKSEYFHKYNELMDMEGLPNSKLKLPEGVEGAGEIIDENNFSVLVPLKSDESSRQFKKVTFGTYLDTVSPRATIEVLFGKGSVQKSVGCSCDEDEMTIMEKLVDYIVAALKGDESSRPNREGAAREFCGCLKDGKFNDYIKGNLKLDVSTLEERGLSVENTPGNFLNKRLGWKEITSLLRGEEINGAKIAGPFRIPDFGSNNCRCLGSGSLEESIKSHVTKAINSKKKVLKEERVIKTILSKIRQQGK